VNQHAALAPQFSGRFLLDPNEINGFGSRGPNKDVQNNRWSSPGFLASLPTVSQTTGTNDIGGYTFPFPVKLAEIYAVHKNSAPTARPWGWCAISQEITANSNTETTTVLLREFTGSAAERDYGNNIKQITHITLTSNDNGGDPLEDVVIPAGAVIGIAVGSPTALGNNNYVDVQAGFLKFDRA